MNDLKIVSHSPLLNRYSIQHEYKSNNTTASKNQAVPHLDQLNHYIETVVHIEEKPIQQNKVEAIAQRVQSGEYIVDSDQLIEQILAEHEF
ncbi:hypothetical protein EP47_04895 [Legionella norrlandica]|uniref:Anti-sigma-28 factor FlgM C-terminal domain-containing protein n=1 Tax=Legionella norrlandica TaxID=1498499 RepID=A0A0A2T8E4_9GAMM|nr:flagellar biosynthesis anti-sigma factor FlgM [Legionella norrlandica]KGP63703.1 hypothetical protein EP47_04895 [Legionella norrlandica]